MANEGTKVTEFYVLKEDKKAIVSEAENIGPSLSRDLVVQLDPGTYFITCVPGMTGNGFHTELTVTGNSAKGADANSAALVEAAARYKIFVLDQATTLLAETKKFAALYTSSKFAEARELYPNARMYWERIEPVAESFGDLDPILDLREADLAPNQEWTGWHRIEKDLWAPKSNYTPLTSAQRIAQARLLVAKTQELLDRVKNLEFKAFQMANGAKELLDEVATGKVTGEEEIWSGTDLWDFQANVEGAEKVYSLVQDVVREKDAKLATELEKNFAIIFKQLDQLRTTGGFRTYSTLDKSTVLILASSVDALAEPLSRLTSVVVG